jgi:CO/xanthine dehydrogenase Mo-binding subunit
MSNVEGKLFIEPERYEFGAAPLHQFELARRDFFKILGAGIAVFAIAKEALAAQETAPGHRSFHNEELPKDINAWLHVGEDGSITGFTGKAEIGQNIRTALAQTIADELRVPFESVRMVTADTALTPFDARTFGSRTMPTITPQLRRVAAAARSARWSSGEGMECRAGGISRRGREGHRSRIGPLAEVCGTRARQNARAESPRRRSHHSGNGMDDCGQGDSKSRCPRVRHWEASIHDRSAACGHVLRQSAAPAVVWRDAHFLR